MMSQGAMASSPGGTGGTAQRMLIIAQLRPELAQMINEQSLEIENSFVNFSYTLLGLVG